MYKSLKFDKYKNFVSINNCYDDVSGCNYIFSIIKEPLNFII